MLGSKLLLNYLTFNLKIGRKVHLKDVLLGYLQIYTKFPDTPVVQGWPPLGLNPGCATQPYGNYFFDDSVSRCSKYFTIIE